MLAHSMLRSVSAGLALLAAAAATQAAEITYPTRPIRFIVPFPPGGSADPLARAFGVWFSDKFGVSVIADNRPGAGTAIAHTLGAKAAHSIPVGKLKRVFACVLYVLAAYMLYKGLSS